MNQKSVTEPSRETLNVVVLISGGGSNLQAFIDQMVAGELPVNIDLVVSNNEHAYGLERAHRAGIETAVIRQQDFATRGEFDQALVARIDQAQPELVILAGFMRILTTEFVNHYARRLINIHPSLLPDYPGVNTHARVLEAGDEWHGVSIHFVVPEVDAGPVILQGKLRVRDDDTPASLQQRIHQIEHKLYPLAVKWFAQDRLTIKDGQVLLDNETSSEQLQCFDL
jgi:phosphoribosylglycinamide formyltransferase-1